MMQGMGRQYVRYFNHNYKRTGTELNPVRAGMVDEPSEYDWSSYAINATDKKSSFCTPHKRYLALG